MRIEIELSHIANTDITGGYWGETIDNGQPVMVEVQDIREARSVAADYIGRNELGGGNWNGGSIYIDGKKVARMSYNRRVWDINTDEEIFSLSK